MVVTRKTTAPEKDNGQQVISKEADALLRGAGSVDANNRYGHGWPRDIEAQYADQGIVRLKGSVCENGTRPCKHKQRHPVKSRCHAQ